MIAYAFDDEETDIIDLKQGEELPEWLLKALVNPEVIKTAHNANFERTCLQKALGVPMPPEQWYCTAVRASTLGLPRSLDEVGRVLGLPEDKAKMKAGKALIRYFSMPCKPTKRNGERTRNLPRHEPEQWEIYKRYCKQDVEAEREIDKLMSKYPEMLETEHQLWCLDQYINEKGVLIQTELVNNILEYNSTHEDELLERAKELTGLDNPKSISQAKEWLAEQGLETESLTKDIVKGLIKETDDQEIQEFLEIRQQLGKTSVSKYDAIKRAINEDNRVRGILQFYGAERTGRWCLAEGSLILVKDERNHIYEKPIEKVLLTDKVWDGENWVTHEGVVFSGDKDVITHDGVTATPEHIVWVSPTEKMILYEAKLNNVKLWAGKTIQPQNILNCDKLK